MTENESENVRDGHDWLDSLTSVRHGYNLYIERATNITYNL
jgi:hypothetical protein